MRFEDDGGTPEWRRRNPPTIHVRGRPRLRDLTLGQIVMLGLFFGYVLPMGLVFGVPAIGALVTALTR